LKLKLIAKKIYQSIKLTQKETMFWNSFSNSEKSYILTGDTAQSLDFTEYQRTGFSVEPQPQDIKLQQEQHWQEPNLFFKTSSSGSDSSEEPDYLPPVQVKRVITTSDDSWPENSNSQPLIQPLTAKQAGEQENLNLDSDSETSMESDYQPGEISTTPAISSKGRPVGSRNIKDSWKNTATTEWKPPRKMVI
jgi:hypothetical protein